VLMQTQKSSNPTYTSSWDCCVQTFQQRGIFGFYRGLPAPLVGSMAEISTLMTSYGFFKRLLGETPDGPELAAWKLAIASGGAGVGVSLVLTPVELVKCKLQVQHTPGYEGTKYKGALECIYRICATESPFGLMRGLTGTLVREIPGNVAWFGAYEAVCWSFRQQQVDKDAKLNPGIYMLAGACAGVAYWTLPYPADTVKSRIQTAPTGQRLKFWPTLQEILQKEGMRGLYRGWGVTALRAAPSNAAVFYAYEMCMAAMGQDFKGHPALDKDSSLDLQHTHYELTTEMHHLKIKVQQLEKEAQDRDSDVAALHAHVATLRAQYASLQQQHPGSPALPDLVLKGAFDPLR